MALKRVALPLRRPGTAYLRHSGCCNADNASKAAGSLTQTTHENPPHSNPGRPLDGCVRWPYGNDPSSRGEHVGRFRVDRLNQRFLAAAPMRFIPMQIRIRATVFMRHWCSTPIPVPIPAWRIRIIQRRRSTTPACVRRAIPTTWIRKTRRC